MAISDSFPLSDGSVLVIGAAGLDVVGRLSSDLNTGTSNPAYIRTTFGGVAHNVAEILARFGQPVALLSAIGLDQAGDQLIDALASADVDVSRLLRSDQFPTGAYLAVLSSSGELLFALDDMRICISISPAYLRRQADLFKQAALIFIDSNLSKDSLRTTFSMARRYECAVCADPTSSARARYLESYLPDIFLITPNQKEAAILCGLKNPPVTPDETLEAAKCLVGKGVGIAIVTLPQFGLCYASAESCGHVPAAIKDVIDPTGAADALSAAVVFALMNEIPLDEAMRLGVCAAALTASHTGAVLPDLSLEKLYDRLGI